jgi:hypothetical protein
MGPAADTDFSDWKEVRDAILARINEYNSVEKAATHAGKEFERRFITSASDAAGWSGIIWSDGDV